MPIGKLEDRALELAGHDPKQIHAVDGLMDRVRRELPALLMSEARRLRAKAAECQEVARRLMVASGSAETVGRRISHARINAGMSQADLAKAIGVEPGMVSHYETGRRNAPVRKLAAIAKALATTLDHLAVGDKK